MTTGRINQVAFLRDVRPACSSTHYLGRGEAITGQDHRSCRGKKCTSYERPGPRPYAREIFRIQKHDRASMHRCRRIMPIDTLGTSSTTEVHQAATRYATQDPYRTPWARRPQGDDIEEECGSTVRCMKHGGPPKEPFPVRPPAGTRRPALAAGAARAVHRQLTGSGLGPPCPALRANSFPEVTDPFCRLPLPTLFHRPEAVHLGDLMRL
ncbi:hypothetical protein V6N13_116667 [Hibiscus sabdariffa]